MSFPSLTTRVLQASLWAFSGRVTGKLLQLLKLVVLARLLAPRDFGLFGIVMLSLAIMESFTESGVEKALVQRREKTEEYLDAAWTLQLTRGLLLAGLMFVSAPLVGWFFNEPKVVPMLRVACFLEILKGGMNIGIIYFQKELQFNKQVIYETSGNLIALAVGIVLAYQLRSAWALVYSVLAGGAAQCLLSYILHPYRPKISLDLPRCRELFGFGKWLLGNSIVMFVAMKADRIVLGRLLGATALGFYNIADQIGGMLPIQFMFIVNKVTMPAFAKIQHDQQRLGRAFLQIFSLTMIATGPLCVFLVVSAPELIISVLGAEWSTAVLPLQIIAVGGFFRGVLGSSSAFFLGTGKPHFDFWKSLLRAVVSLSLVFPLTIYLGMPGTATAMTMASGMALLPFFIKVLRATGTRLQEVASHALAGLLLTVCTGLGMGPGKMFFDPAFESLLVQVTGGGLGALAAVAIISRFRLTPWPLISNYWQGIKSRSSLNHKTPAAS